MTKTQLRAYARRAALGDVSETDGDVLMAASRVGVARSSFPTQTRARPSDDPDERRPFTREWTRAASPCAASAPVAPAIASTSGS